MAKRIFDIIVSLIAILIFVFPSIFIAFLILLTSSRPIIYWSRRIGSNDLHFNMPKFRTMKLNTPEVETDKLSNPQEYLTPLGSFLRRTSIDELPQLYSVLIGDMSLVGPRPALYNQYDLISKRKKLGVNILKPGITGWAQIYGRDQNNLNTKIKLDCEYLQKQSILLDFKILFLTIFNVITKKNIIH